MSTFCVWAVWRGRRVDEPGGVKGEGWCPQSDFGSEGGVGGWQFSGGDGGLGFGLQAKTLYSKVPALCVWGGREGGET